MKMMMVRMMVMIVMVSNHGDKKVVIVTIKRMD